MPKKLARNYNLRFRGKRGATLVEILIAMVIITIGVLGFMGAFTGISKSIQISKNKGLASNLAQEKIESLKNITYPRLLVTTFTATEVCGSTVTYDAGYYPKESIVVGDIPFERAVYIRKVSEDASGNLEYKNWDDADTSLKEVLIHILYREGSECKSLSLRNLRDDPNRRPLDATFSGTVSSGVLGGAAIQDARVEVLENTSWKDTTDASGNYSFRVAAGTYTLKVTRTGFFSGTRSNLSINNGSISDQDFALIPMASGTVSGTAHLRDHLVISQVVASSGTQGGVEVEVIELYNPTTYAWTIDDPTLDVIYRQKQGAGSNVTINLTYHTTTLPSQGYYLIASTSPITFMGVTRTADAEFNGMSSNVIKNASSDGGIGIKKPGASTYYDRVAWSNDSAQDPPLEFVETTAFLYPGFTGLADGDHLVRLTSSTMLTTGIGRAYDTDKNLYNFTYIPMIGLEVLNSSIIQAPETGTPAGGAIVSATDGLSSPVVANSSGTFQLVSVATGTWTVTISSGILYTDRTSVAVTANTTTPLGTVGLTSSTANGYISG
ncbi:MAG: carboxypeptidase regulatory-like domain-containing protein, partial [Elusimicrobia bacterium]|nr:carboxypeptidase regulatory-like domain-containing protein [Elusimicrobiota bacterium]